MSTTLEPPRAATRRPPGGFRLAMKELWTFLASLKLLLAILILGFIPLALGTFFKQKALGGFDPEQEMHRLGPGVYALLETFGVFNIYHSWYFLGLLILLSINNVCCTIDRFFFRLKKLTPKAWGVIIIHVGVNVVLLGAGISNRTGTEGFMQLFEGQRSNQVINPVTMQPSTLPFAVELDDFRLVHYKDPDERLILFDANSRETQAVVPIDTSRPLPQTAPLGSQSFFAKFERLFTGGATRAVRVDQYYPDARSETVIRPTPDGSGVWAVDVDITMGDQEGSGYLVAGNSRRLTLVPDQLSVGYVRARTPAAFEQALASRPGAGDEGPTLVVHRRDTHAESRYPAKVDEPIALPDSDVTITVLRYEPNYQRANNPAVQVEVRDGDSVRKGWLLGRFASISQLETPSVRVNFRQGPPRGSTPDELDLVAGPAGERKVVHRHRGQVVHLLDAPAGETVVIPGLEVHLTPREYIDGGEAITEVKPGSDQRRSPAVQVTLLERGAPTQTLWLFEGEAQAIQGGLGLVFRQDFPIKEFQSDLSIFKGGKKIIDRREIIVNRYLNVGGYHIYQASYDQDSERWSGLQIKRDPGIPVIYSGFTVMFLGILFLFYVRPILDARQRGEPLIPEAGTAD